MPDLIKVTEHNVESPTENLKMDVDPAKSFEDRAKDVATLIATKKALDDDKLVDDITGLKKAELSEHAKANLKKGQAVSKEADKELQKKTFGIYEGLASYIGLKRDLPNAMLKILMFFIQPTLGALLLVTGLLVGTINVLMDGINSIVERFSAFADGTRKVVKSLFWIAIAVIAIAALLAVLEGFGIYLI